MYPPYRHLPENVGLCGRARAPGISDYLPGSRLTPLQRALCSPTAIPRWTARTWRKTLISTCCSHAQRLCLPDDAVPHLGQRDDHRAVPCGQKRRGRAHHHARHPGQALCVLCDAELLPATLLRSGRAHLRIHPRLRARKNVCQQTTGWPLWAAPTPITAACTCIMKTAAQFLRRAYCAAT